MSNPHRKFDLLRIITAALGPDLSRREMSVADLETLAAKHGVDVGAARSS